jgi:capsular polysaccharide biosynthesis protein
MTSRDLGTGGANQFIIIDPALLPIKPTKPNRPQLIAAGVLLGLFFGLAAVILKELLDTTVRTPRDVEVFQKPIIAFITDGRRQLPE